MIYKENIFFRKMFIVTEYAALNVFGLNQQSAQRRISAMQFIS